LPTKQGTIKGENMVFDIESIELWGGDVQPGRCAGIY
jgi:hypothetical protein